jgi:hypothetical protein
MEAIYSSETFFDFQRNASGSILEDSIFRNHNHENLTFYMPKKIFSLKKQEVRKRRKKLRIDEIRN